MIQIRLLTPDDAPAWRRLRLAALQECPESFLASYEEECDLAPDEWRERITPRLDGSRWTLGAFAAADGLVGTLGFTRETRLKSRHRGMLAGLYVHPAYRGRGIARALLNEALERARRLPGLRRVGLYVTVGNRAARALYVAAGFQSFGVEPDAMEVNGRRLAEEYLALAFEPATPDDRACPLAGCQ